MTSEAVVREERLARVALSVSWEPGDARLAAQIEEVGAEATVEALIGKPVAGARRTASQARLRAAEPVSVLDRAEATGVRFVVPGDEEWPESLDVLAHVERDGFGGRPFGLWARGPLRLNEVLARSVSVVGSRAASAYGEFVATELGAGLAERGACVVSGAAYGIDAAAHRGALAVGGRTVAVLACGVDVPYPRGNAQLLSLIAAEGLIVSEVPLGSTPTRPRFLVRNRVIAAATPGTVLVEAAPRSGALNTAGWVHLCHHLLMGVPGPVTSSLSAGVHDELRRGAAVVTDASEVMDLVGVLGADAATERRGPGRPWDGLPPVAAAVFEAMPSRGRAPLGALCARAPASPRECLAALGLLVSRGLVEQDGSGWRLVEAVRKAARATSGPPAP